MADNWGLPDTELDDVVTRRDLRSLMSLIKENFLLKKDVPDFNIEAFIDPKTGMFNVEHLPGYVDKVIEKQSVSDFPKEGTAGVMYMCLDDNEIYRWSGSQYVKISDSSKSAAKLTTARTINGVPFDGTHDILIGLPNEDAISAEDAGKYYDKALSTEQAAPLEKGMTVEQANSICADTIGSFPEPVEIKK